MYCALADILTKAASTMREVQGVLRGIVSFESLKPERQMPKNKGKEAFAGAHSERRRWAWQEEVGG